MAGKEKVDFAAKYAVGDQLWVPHDVEAFVCGRVESVSQTRIELKVEGQSENLKFIVNNKDPMPAFEVAGGHIHDNVENLVDLDELSEPAILHHARKRFKKKLIYTHVGSILVAINPFESLDIYGPKDMQKAAKEYFPHVFVTAATAYKQLLENQKNQSVLISGESGAGKTETTKKVLSYLATVAKAQKTAGSAGDDVTIEDKILQSNPLLEALGNAKTLRNNNSSRFGKYMRVDFDGNSKISGCEIINYLLEKSRVIVQTDNERNYHIFYQLIRGVDMTTKARLLLKDDVMFYNYLNQSGCDKIDKVDDRTEFADVMQAMKTLQFSQQLQNDILTVLSAILHIGNIEFEESQNRDSCIISPDSSGILKETAHLLGVEVNSLSFSFTDKLVAVGKASVVGMKLNINQALDGRDTLAKALYSFMFDFIITQVNSTLKLSDNAAGKSSGSIGILDIFGFEIFQINSFEQLCINYANEKLQHHFNDVIFNEEKKMYESEGVATSEIKFEDNSLCVTLVEGKPFGLLSILDEECSLGNGTDLSYIAKAEKTFGKDKAQYNAYFVKDRIKPNVFSVLHFAGKVDYSVEGFLDKNRDSMSKTTMDMIVQSKVPLIRNIFQEKAAAIAAQDDKGGGGKKLSLGGNFRAQLIGLLTTLRATEPHFIRCVKPNEQKKGGILDGNMTLRQLRYAGLFEAIRIRKSGYSYRASHDVFANLYRLILDEKALVKCKNMSNSDICKEILNEAQNTNVLPKGISFLGTTKVFLKSTSHKTLLERAKAGKVTKFVISIQKTARMFLGKVTAFRRKYEKIKVQQAEIKEKMRFHIAATVIQKYVRGYSIRVAMAMMQELIDLRTYLMKRDMINIKFLVAKMEKKLYPSDMKSRSHKPRNESMSKLTQLFEEENDDEQEQANSSQHANRRKSTKIRRETPRQRGSKLIHGLVTKEVFVAKAFIKIFDMQHFYLDSLNKAILSGDVLRINDFVVKCEKVDLSKHETVVKAKRELQVIYSKKVLIEKMLYFLKFNEFSSNVINLPLSTQTRFYNINEIIETMPESISEARRMEIDEAFVIKVEQIYHNVIPKLGLRIRYRSALKLVDTVTVIQCLHDAANMSGVISYIQKDKSEFNLVAIGDDGKDIDDAVLSSYESALHIMIQMIENLPDRETITPGFSNLNELYSVTSKLVFLDKEFRATRSLFSFLQLEKLLDSPGESVSSGVFSTKLEDQEEATAAQAVAPDHNPFGPRLTDTMIYLCRAITRSNGRDDRRTAELELLLMKRCYDNIHLYEQVIRTYKWSSLITCGWEDFDQSQSVKEAKLLTEGSFFGYSCEDAKNSPYAKNFILSSADEGASPSKKLGSPSSGATSPMSASAAAANMDLPVSVINTIRSCNKLNLEGDEGAGIASVFASFASPQGGKSSTTTPKKKTHSMAPGSASRTIVGLSPYSTTPNVNSPHPHLSSPRKAVLDMGHRSLHVKTPDSKSSTPSKVPMSPGAAELFKYVPKKTDFLSPHAAMYEDIVQQNQLVDDEEKQQHSRLEKSRTELQSIKQDMRHISSKMEAFSKANGSRGWK